MSKEIEERWKRKAATEKKFIKRAKMALDCLPEYFRGRTIGFFGRFREEEF